MMNATLIQFLKYLNGTFDRVFARYRMLLIVGSHLVLVAFANVLSFFFRFEGVIPQDYQLLCFQMLPILLLIFMMSLWVFGLFHGLWRYVGYHDLVRIVFSCLVGALAFFAFTHGVLQVSNYPRSTIILTGLLSAGFLGGIRLTFRWFREWFQGAGTKGRRVLLVGAGNAGELLVRDLQSNANHDYLPVAFVDDDIQKQKMRIHGIPVAGEIKNIPDVAQKFKAEEIIVCMPSASPQVRQKILFACEPCSLSIKTLPNVKQLLDQPVLSNRLHDYTLEDLLQRDPIQMNLEELHPLLKKKRILVTGAGGSIGTELCRQIGRYKPSMLVLFDWHENSLYALYRELRELFPELHLHTTIGDVSNKRRVEEIFVTHHPQLVFHAAAHKHVPLMEANPGEAVRNNILGTKIVAEVALKTGVERFVLISSDKAVNPTNVMGATKWVAESIINHINKNTSSRFIVVRFGNVLGSNGSVVPIFKEQIQKGGPLTITHPDMMRYFMTIPESVQLILQASAIGQGGDVFVLDMGTQIYVSDLARNMIRLSGFIPDRDIKIVHTGLRPGEKLYEELFYENEKVEPTQYSKINRAVTACVINSGELTRHLEQLCLFLHEGKPEKIIEKLIEIVPGYSPAANSNSLAGLEKSDLRSV